MKKIFAYTLTAVLLGAVLMLFPLRIFYVFHGEEGPLIDRSPYVKSLAQSDSWEALSSLDQYTRPESFTSPLDAENVTTQPTDPFVGILAVSFLVALVVYFLFGRRRPDPWYRYSQYLRRF